MRKTTQQTKGIEQVLIVVFVLIVIVAGFVINGITPNADGMNIVKLVP